MEIYAALVGALLAVMHFVLLSRVAASSKRTADLMQAVNSEMQALNAKR